jgi:hypothetical protein
LNTVCRDIHLTPQEEKIARLALDPAAADGEITSAADKLVRAWRERNVTTEKLSETQVRFMPPIILEKVKEQNPWKPIAAICLGIGLLIAGYGWGQNSRTYAEMQAYNQQTQADYLNNYIAAHPLNTAATAQLNAAANK